MSFPEPLKKLDPRHIDMERARKSLREELEAIDLYQERVDATQDTSLKQLMTHNMNEEKKHAVMLIEWLRENDPELDEMFRPNRKA
jgi:uncharacterized protein